MIPSTVAIAYNEYKLKEKYSPEPSILHKLVSRLSAQVDELQKQNETYKNDIKTLKKVVAHFDESQVTIIDILKTHEQKMEEHDYLINDESLITINEQSPLTKKQKLSRKKHLRRKEKRKQQTQEQEQDIRWCE